jgi:hypothetical protein
MSDRTLFYVAFAYTLCTPFLAFFNVAVASAALLAGVVLIFACRLSELESITLGPLKAVRAAVQEVNATIAQVRSVATMFAKPILGALNRGDMAYLQKFALKDQIDSGLKALGLSDAQIMEAAEVWNKLLALDHVRMILRATGFPPIIAYATFGLIHESHLEAASPDVCRDILSRNRMQNPEVDAALEDYRYFLEHKSVRRPDVWKDVIFLPEYGPNAD